MTDMIDMIDMTDMEGLAGTVSAGASIPAPAVAFGPSVGGQTGDAVGAVVSEAVAPVMSAMSSMCDNVCVADVSVVCMMAGGLSLLTLLALVLATRRNTFLALVARARPRDVLRRWRCHQPAWTVLSPISLCVLRV
ncbi:hypothetical protein [Nocardioides zhouii]|uniref:Uncharacterized protein n=1 Tax=Nocardioides zhouii TaxID=1168729 RepID=A0A4Q2SNF2_9ACTN|nr:hypothetical protein [Nocardioides zhouii]RYC07286.1 hypothetical protein EUA94_15530 [Nocardioides zhouii]